MRGVQISQIQFLVFHRTDTHIQVLSLALAFLIHSKFKTPRIYLRVIILILCVLSKWHMRVFLFKSIIGFSYPSQFQCDIFDPRPLSLFIRLETNDQFSSPFSYVWQVRISPSFCRILFRTVWVHTDCLVVSVPFLVLEVSDGCLTPKSFLVPLSSVPSRFRCLSLH